MINKRMRELMFGGSVLAILMATGHAQASTWTDAGGDKLTEVCNGLGCLAAQVPGCYS